MKNFLKLMKKIIIGIVLVVFFSVAITITILLLNFNDYGVTQFNDKSLVIIKDEISSDQYKKGDVVVVKQKKFENIKEGDELFAYFVEENGSVRIDFGKVGNTYEEEKNISFENGATYQIKYVIGSSEKVYENIGKYLSILESKWGFLFIVLVPSFLIFVYEIYALIVEIKYGKEE